MKKKTMKCECCNKEIITTTSQKYCVFCSSYTALLRKEISYLQREVRRLKTHIYGVPDGRLQRVMKRLNKNEKK